MIRININDINLTLDNKPTNWGAGVSLYNGVLFTGIIEEYFNGTSQLSSESELKEGILHGRQVEYFSNGQIESEFFERYDGFYGTKKRWNEQGVLIYDAEYDDDSINLWSKKYDNQGVLIGRWIRGKRIL